MEKIVVHVGLLPDYRSSCGMYCRKYFLKWDISRLKYTAKLLIDLFINYSFILFNYKAHSGIVTHAGKLFWTQPNEGKICWTFRNEVDIQQELFGTGNSAYTMRSPRGITMDTRDGLVTNQLKYDFRLDRF